jgi:thiosulfate/3-mercaptopyruvate sulfurtransferase
MPILITLACAAANACGSHGTSESLLVSTAWLADRLRDPKLVVLAVADAKSYGEEHIPGALRIDLSFVQAASGPGKLTLELPPAADIVETFRNLGVSSDSHVVLYFAADNWASRTTRIFLTLDSIGMGGNTSILNGGLAAWKAEGRPVTAEVRGVVRGDLTACPQSDVVADLDYVRGNLNHAGVALIDARDPQYYNGASAAEGKRPGHIPGAANLTYSTLLDATGKFKSPEELSAMFRGAGVKPGDRVVSYCHIGQQATVVYFVARYLGYDARLYDGSWEEWSAHRELPAVLEGGRK